MKESPAILKLRRQFLEQWIEQAIALLDALDGECDLEDNGDAEPWIPSPPRFTVSRVWHDLEEDSDSESSGDEMDCSVGMIAGGCGL